jgi:uncharacterized membrane protein YhfC
MALVCVILLVQLPLMLGLPLWLGRRIARRWGVPWRLWGAGALTFVASQIVHLPLNWAVGLLGTSRGLGLLPLVPVALAAGLSAGLCEELARYVTLRFVMRSPKRTWKEAIQFGAGHGGIEAMILGAIVALSLGTMVLFRFVSPSSFGLDPSTAAALTTARDKFFATPWFMGLAGGFERVFAITSHVGFSVLVMRAVARRKVGYLGAAIAGHAFLDALALWASRTVGVWATEGIVALFAAGMLALTLALRDPEGATVAAPP